jgi:hypothetical protein
MSSWAAVYKTRSLAVEEITRDASMSTTREAKPGARSESVDTAVLRQGSGNCNRQWCAASAERRGPGGAAIPK